MARKRDYKREYQNSLARARAAGYKSQRDYRQARKALGTPRRASPLPRKVARAVIRGTRDDISRAWSGSHSKSPATRFKASWSEGRKERFYRTFVEPDVHRTKKVDTPEWYREFENYLVPDVYSKAEFDERYGYKLN